LLVAEFESILAYEPAKRQAITFKHKEMLMEYTKIIRGANSDYHLYELALQALNAVDTRRYIYGDDLIRQIENWDLFKTRVSEFCLSDIS